MGILYHSTNNPAERVSFRQALLNGMASRYGLYMMDREDVPAIGPGEIADMASLSYAQIAFRVLYPYVHPDIPEKDFRELLEDAYDERVIPVDIQQVTDDIALMWLSRGPTYSFKDFAARFFARALNYFLGREGLRRIVVVATSGDTGGAVAHALLGLENVSNVVFFPRDGISERQRRQMTTLGENVYAFAVNGDFDVCQELAKALLSDRELAGRMFGDRDRFTSANSISIGRLLPQAVYPFYAYSRIRGRKGGRITASIPSGNFGDMMGTVLAKAMGLPIGRILIGVNENREFPEFLRTGSYRVEPSVWSPSTAMIVSHPSNLARLVEFYGGYMYDRVDPQTRKVTEPGVIDRMPRLEELRRDMFSVAVSNQEHYDTIREVYQTHGVLLDPHGAVGWRALQRYTEGREPFYPSVIYETADPGKFPEDIRKAVGLEPPVPSGIREQAHLPERVFEITEPPVTDRG
ncbi:MAG: threonine synthase, partial [Spirochaetota bacterium]